MTTLLYLFDLQAGVDPADYEEWATTVDLQRLRSLPSVRSYRIVCTDTLAGEPHSSGLTDLPRYIEILDVVSVEQFQHEMAQDDLAEVATTFRRYARAPKVLTCAELVAAPSDLATAHQLPSPGRPSPAPDSNRHHTEEDSMSTEMTVQPSQNQVNATPAASPGEANAHFRSRLAYEADPADITNAIASDKVDFTLVDCRPAGNYNKAHLPGAVSLPWRDITTETAAELPDGLLITYCWGPSCNAATKGAERLSRYGRQVKEMIGGIEYWIREGHSTEGRRPIVRGEEKPSDWGLVT